MNQPRNIAVSLLFFICSLPYSSKAQINSFTIIERSGKTIIGWVNPNPDIRQLVIQRSKDSVEGFKSIISMPDPTAYTNGYVDKPRDSTIHYYYRIFSTYPGGKYFFTVSKKAGPDPFQAPKPIEPAENKNIKTETSLKKELPQKPKESIPEKKQPQEIINLLEQKGNINETTIHTLSPKTDSLLQPVIDIPSNIPARERNIERIRPIPTATIKIEGIKKMEKAFIPDSSILNLYEPSGFIYANKDGNLVIVLPEPAKKHFTLKVFREDGTTVFVMRNIKESELLIDRSNFFHSGWFKYELSENGKIREKNKFFIPAQIK
jgi:hypothetical protein